MIVFEPSGCSYWLKIPDCLTKGFGRKTFFYRLYILFILENHCQGLSDTNNIWRMFVSIDPN